MRHFLSVNDCTSEELHGLLALSADLKGKDKNNTQERILEGKILAMVFEKASLRTRMSFQVAMADLGGIGIYRQLDDKIVGLPAEVAKGPADANRVLPIRTRLEIVGANAARGDVAATEHAVVDDIADNDVPQHFARRIDDDDFVEAMNRRRGRGAAGQQRNRH